MDKDLLDLTEMAQALDAPNPAMVKHTSMSPALIEEIKSDQNAALPLYRAMHADIVHNLHANKSLLTVSQQVTLADHLAKIAFPPQKQAQAVEGSGFSLVINLPQVTGARNVTGDVIDGD